MPDLNSVLYIESYGHEEDIAEAIFTHKKELTVDKRIEYIEKENSSIKLKNDALLSWIHKIKLGTHGLNNAVYMKLP